MPRVAVRRLGWPRGPRGNLLGPGMTAGTSRGPRGVLAGTVQPDRVSNKLTDEPE